MSTIGVPNCVLFDLGVICTNGGACSSWLRNLPTIRSKTKLINANI
jgi:hypothetical protein